MQIFQKCGSVFLDDDKKTEGDISCKKHNASKNSFLFGAGMDIQGGPYVSERFCGAV